MATARKALEMAQSNPEGCAFCFRLSFPADCYLAIKQPEIGPFDT